MQRDAVMLHIGRGGRVNQSESLIPQSDEQPLGADNECVMSLEVRVGGCPGTIAVWPESVDTLGDAREMTMPKAGELTYFEQIGENGRHNSLHKPFSLQQPAGAASCGDYLLAFGGVATLLNPTPARLLDLGCGTGWTSCFFARMGFEVVGQDVSSHAINLAREFAAAQHLDGLTFTDGDYESLDYENEFDNAVFFDSLHHAVDERRALESVYRALRPGGICVTREPGVGHADAPHSIHAVETYGVTERDMPPTRIAAHAFAIGFREVSVHPFPDWLFRTACANGFSRVSAARNPLKQWWRKVRGSLSAARAAGRIHWQMERGGLVQLVK